MTLLRQLDLSKQSHSSLWNIAEPNFSYWELYRRSHGFRETEKQPKWRKPLSLIQYPTSNSDQDQMFQKCQKIHIWVDFLLYLGGDLFLGAVSSASVKPAVQLLTLSLSIQNPKSEGSIPWGTFLLVQTWQARPLLMLLNSNWCKIKI